MKTITLPGGERLPALGMGTWMIGEQPAKRAEEIATLQHGIELGMSVIDTAEMYGEGASEKLVGEAIKGRREKVFLISKVYPHNASKKGTPLACERSLQRLGVDCLDLYLLHWRGNHPLEETVAVFEQLKAQGKIRHWGVSNLDKQDMQELYFVPDGAHVAANQVLYNLSRRGIEFDLKPWCEQRQIPLIAYSPIEQARLLAHPQLAQLAKQNSMSTAQLCLAWLLQQKQVVVIPKASNRAHLEENFAALTQPIDEGILKAMDVIFPPPKRAKRLEML